MGVSIHFLFQEKYGCLDLLRPVASLIRTIRMPMECGSMHVKTQIKSTRVVNVLNPDEASTSMRNLFFASQLLLLTMLFNTTTQAASAEAWGPDLGSPIGDPLDTIDQDGNKQSFTSLVGEKGLAIVFLRSLDWCRFCKAQAKELDARIGDFTARGIRLVILSYDSVATLKTFQLKHTHRLTLLSDPQSNIVKHFGILNQRQKPGSRGFGIPNPGIMIVDTKGIIRAKFAEKSYRKRPQIDTVLVAIDQLEL